MSDKELEKLIKDSIDLDFKDISSKLKVPEEKPKKGWFKYGTAVCSLIVIVVGSYFLINTPSSELEPGEDIKENILNVNKISYEYGEEKDTNLELSITDYKKLNSILELNDFFDYKFKINNNDIFDILCYYVDNHQFKQCNIEYSDGKTYITVAKNEYPKFFGELYENWNDNISNIKINSKISNMELVIIQNLNNQKNVDQYFLKDVVNYRTKFIYDGIGYSIETYDLELEEFEKIVENIIDKK